MTEQTYERMLLALGYEAAEATILALLIKGRQMTANEVEEESGLSRGKVYQILSKLVDERKIYKTSDRPSVYATTDHFLDQTKESISRILETAVPNIVRAKRRTQSQIIQETLDAFQSIGYAIEDPPLRTSGDLANPFLDMSGFFDYIAVGEYRFAISFIDETKKRFAERIVDNGYFIPIVIEQQRFGCIASFLIVMSDFALADRFMNSIRDNPEVIMTQRFPEFEELPRFIGIEKHGPYVIKSSENVTSFVTRSILELHAQRALLNQEMKKIQKNISDIERITTDSEVMARRLSQFPSQSSRILLMRNDERMRELISRMSPPIQQIALREKRNLDLIKIEYRKFFIEVNEYIESMERRYYIPTIETINKFVQRVEKIKLRMDSVAFELKSLEREFFYPALPTFRKTKSWPNPFVFTVPFEPRGPYIINQEEIAEEIKKLVERISAGLTGTFRFISGEQGLGKSHILKNLAIPLFGDGKILAIEIDCPLKMDLMDALFPFWERLPPDIASDLRQSELAKEEPPLSLKNFIEFLDQLVESAISRKYKGVVFLIDEFENPFQPLLSTPELRMPIEPLPIRQLREILSAEIPHLGFLFFCRRNAFDFFCKTLPIKDFDKFVLDVRRLKPEQLDVLIKHRYSLMEIEAPEIAATVLEEVFKRTNGNTRGTLRYLRELFRYANLKRQEKITTRTLSAIEPLPLFDST